MAETKPRRRKDRPATGAEIAALRFDAIPTDPQAFTLEKWRVRARDEFLLVRAMQGVVGQDDAALTATVAEDPGFYLECAEHFREQAQLYRDGAEVFQGAVARLMVALERTVGEPAEGDA